MAHAQQPNRQAMRLEHAVAALGLAAVIGVGFGIGTLLGDNIGSTGGQAASGVATSQRATDAYAARLNALAAELRAQRADAAYSARLNGMADQLRAERANAAWTARLNGLAEAAGAISADDRSADKPATLHGPTIR